MKNNCGLMSEWICFALQLKVLSRPEKNRTYCQSVC